jgi:hypothetical protein
MSSGKELIIVMLLGISGVIIWNIYFSSMDKLYTVGVVTGMQTGKTSGTNVNFYFDFDGKRYVGLSAKGFYSARKGDRFIVAFEKEKVSFSKILLYYPIPDSLKIEIPKTGWAEIPEEAKRFRLKRKEDFGLREYFHKDRF